MFHKMALCCLLLVAAVPCLAQNAVLGDALAASLREELAGRGMPEKFLFLPYVLSGQVFADERAGLWSLSALDAVRFPSPDLADGGDVRGDEAVSTAIALARLEELHDRLGDWDRAAVAFAEGPSAEEGYAADGARPAVLSLLDAAWERFADRPGEAFAAIPDRLAERDRARAARLASRLASRQERSLFLSERQKALAAAAEGESFTYTVRRGDTLGALALRYKVRVSDLKKWNNLRGDMIREGQKLVIRKP